MPLDFTGVNPGLRILSSQVRQLYDLVTGAMTDQPITPAYIFRLINNLGLDATVLGADPAAPGASIARLYPKADGWYFRLGAAGAVTPLATPALGSVNPNMINAAGAAANTVLLLTGANTWVFGPITPGYFASGAAMFKLGQAELSGTASSVQFSSIPQTYKNLLLAIDARSSVAALTDTLTVRLNGDTGANYDQINLRVINTTVTGAQALGATSAEVGVIPGASGTANYFGQYAILFPAYTRAVQKGMISDGGSRGTSTAADLSKRSYHAWWKNTAAITQIDVQLGTGPNFISGCSFYLYGIPG